MGSREEHGAAVGVGLEGKLYDGCGRKAAQFGNGDVVI